jgi:hypothetical protein
MQIPPERLYRPDVSIIAWRRLCEHPRSAGQSGSVFSETVGEQEIDVASA